MNELIAFITAIIVVFGNLFLLGFWIHNTLIANDESGNFYNDHIRSNYKYDPSRTLRLLLTLILTTLISSVLFIGFNLVTLTVLNKFQEVIQPTTFRHLMVLCDMGITLLSLYLFRKIFIEIKYSQFIDDILNTLYSDVEKSGKQKKSSTMDRIAKDAVRNYEATNNTKNICSGHSRVK